MSLNKHGPFEWRYLISILKVPLFTGASEEIDEKTVKEVHEILFTIDEHYFPNGNEWIAGETLTAADFAYISTLSTIVVSTFCLPFLLPNFKIWTFLGTRFVTLEISTSWSMVRALQGHHARLRRRQREERRDDEAIFPCEVSECIQQS